MKNYCTNHPEKVALSICNVCKKYYCKECLVEGRIYYYCHTPPCYNEYLKENSVMDINTNESNKVEEETKDSKVFIWLIYIYPFFLFFISYIYSVPAFIENSDHNLGYIIGAALLFFIVPLLVVRFRRLKKKKRLSDKEKVKLYYGISFVLFILLMLGQLARYGKAN